MELPATGHDPVLIDEVLDHLKPEDGAVLVDCTVGRGGHSRALAERLGSNGVLIGLDADPRNLAFAQQRLEGVACPVRLFHANFTELGDVLAEVGRERVDGILADLGISTNQLFEADYGMSFAREMPLDMRIDPRSELTAADVVNRYDEGDLADLIYQLADERFSRRIARKIVAERARGPIKTTERLAEIVRSAVPGRGRSPDAIDPATRTFMALRMEVNHEMGNLGRLLREAPVRLAEGGVLAVISFHSGEDRLVKNAFRELQTSGAFEVVTRKPVVPGEAEVISNPRSRSAKLRVIRRTSPVV